MGGGAGGGGGEGGEELQGGFVGALLAAPVRHNVPQAVLRLTTSHFQNQRLTTGLWPVRAQQAAPLPETHPASPPVALISHRLWTTLFGANEKIVGSPIDLEEAREDSVFRVQNGDGSVFELTGDGTVTEIEPFYSS